MSWIESHQELARHPKTRRLARTLGISIPTAIGHLHLLWWWALDFADDGDLSRFEAEDIADGMIWEGDPDAAVDALASAGFLDADQRIHDWDDFAGRLVQRRKSNAERMRETRATHVQRTFSARADTCEATVPNPTVQDSTVPSADAETRALAHEAPAAPTASEMSETPENVTLDAFNTQLHGLNGYEPSPDFLRKVAQKYGVLDLEEEALKIRGWAKAHPKRLCTTAFVLNWLKTAIEPRAPVVNGHARAGPPRQLSTRMGDDGDYSEFAKYGQAKE